MTTSDYMRGRGFTLVEMIISISLVGIGLVAALNTVGASKVSQFKVSTSRQGHLLAQGLMTEILRQDYADPVDGPDSFGLSAAESATGDRSLFDDVDDYDGWGPTPAEYKDGVAMSGLGVWTRKVEVTWVNPSNLIAVVVNNQGVKRITVKVSHDGMPVAKLVALKTVGLPSLEACCFGDGSCEDLRVEACAAQGGIAQGPDASCAGTMCPIGPAVLFVVTDDTLLTAQELARQMLMESWDFRVELIAASAAQSYFDAAVANADTAYVSEGIVGADLGTKLVSTVIGVVNEAPELVDEFGFSTGYDADSDGGQLYVADNANYITTVFTIGDITVYSETTPSTMLLGSNAPDLRVLMTRRSQDQDEEVLSILEAGAALFGGGNAAGRRVQLPWGQPGFDFNDLTTDGQTIMKRAIKWAAGFDMICGNGLCEAGEDCNGCATDCPGVTTGPLSGWHCCGNGVVETAEGDGTICDGNY